MIDKRLVARRFGAHFETYDREAAVQMSICDRMASMIEAEDMGDIESALEIGAGTGFLSSHLLRMMPSAKWLFNDISDQSEPFVRRYVERYGASSVEFCCCDGESEIDGEYDLIASCSAIQWFTDLEAFTRRLSGMIREGGYVALSLFAPDNFKEVMISNRDIGLSYLSLEQMRGLLEAAGFTITASWEQCHRLLLPSPMDVLRHIKLTGVSGASSSGWSRGRLHQFCDRYSEMFGFDLGVTLTYHPIIVIAKKS